MFELRFLKRLDFTLLIVTILLAFFGALVIFSATRFDEKVTRGDQFYFLKKQITWIVLGIIALIFMLVFNYDSIARFYKPIYLANLLMLLVVLKLGRATFGAQRWISVGGFRFQPSEFAKIALIISLAMVLANKEEQIRNFRTILVSFLHIAIPILLVFEQPDLGTSLVFLAIWTGMLFGLGAQLLHLGYVFAVSGLGFWFLWSFDILKEYQKKRLLVFLNPNIDPLGAGYHSIQALIAVGSGGILGKGLFKGTQGHLHFIPAQYTDFPFTTVGEELGLIGCLILLLLYFIIIWRGIQIALNAKDTLGRLLAIGVVSMFALQIFVNIGMTMKIMPITGVPLPFLSYGGSSLIANMMAIGLLNNIWVRRHKIMF